MAPILLVVATLSASAVEPDLPVSDQGTSIHSARMVSLRRAINDLTATYGAEYRRAPEFLARLAKIERAKDAQGAESRQALSQLAREALLANPELRKLKILVVKRRFPGRRAKKQTATNRDMQLGMPSNHECNSSLSLTGWENEIALLDLSDPKARLQTVYTPPGSGYVGELDLHWDGQRMLFTQSDEENWKIWELDLSKRDARQVSRLPGDVDCMDPTYLPNGDVIFGSTACYQSVPCWHGRRRVTNLYRMDANGGHVRRLCYDQDHDLHPTVLSNGQVLYNRWEYAGIVHIYLRQLMVMNPDGTGQRSIYGSNSWYPNSLYFTRPIPRQPDRFLSILSGYHGPHRMGQLVVIDANEGWHAADGLVQRLSGSRQAIDPQIRDVLVQKDWPKFLHPYPLNEKVYLVAAQLTAQSPWGIYLADAFDNLVEIKALAGWALLEPTPLASRPRPPVIADRVDLERDDAVIYIGDIYRGRGLAGVPRGTIHRLRIAAYDFGYPGLAGPDKVGYGGPWEVMRILGTAPVEDDGSALFRVPANTPITIQPLDGEGKAVQLMRSWYTAMPGERVSCTGCHETPRESGPSPRPGRAALREPSDLEPWYGPARGFDFAREVQPVLDRYCTECHNGAQRGAAPDLRGAEQRPEYKGRMISDLGISRLDPAMKMATDGRLKYSPAYDALIGYLRRVGIEDDASLLEPGAYYADTSELIQMLRKGHAGVELDDEAWDRLITWIDLNAPCHGTWGEVWPVPEEGSKRRRELAHLTGGVPTDYDSVPTVSPFSGASNVTISASNSSPAVHHRANVADWPFSEKSAKERQAALGSVRLQVELNSDVTLSLHKIPAGNFPLGDEHGEPDERPVDAVTVTEAFWISSTEVTNQMYRLFDAEHDSRYYNKRHASRDDQGLTLNDDLQPVVRVSWSEASAFCRWLSRRTGRSFHLPTELQWEWAARAGSDSALWFGPVDADPTDFANLAGREFSRPVGPNAEQITGGVHHLVMEGSWTANLRFDDAAIVTEPVGSRRPNPWGLYDMAGNVAEWTRSSEKPYPYGSKDGRERGDATGRKIVRGGSFFDRPQRARSGIRQAYPYWMKVFNVGFRVVCEPKT